MSEGEVGESVVDRIHAAGKVQAPERACCRH